MLEKGGKNACPFSSMHWFQSPNSFLLWAMQGLDPITKDSKKCKMILEDFKCFSKSMLEELKNLSLVTKSKTKQNKGNWH